MKLFKKISFVFLIILLIACGSEEHITPVDLSLTETPLITAIPSRTPFPTLPMRPTFTVGPTLTPTLTPTLNPTHQSWLSTAIPKEIIQKTLTQQAREFEATQVSQFSSECENIHYYFLSPDTKWLATNCGNENAKTLYLQNKKGIVWSIEYTDLFGKDAWDGESSSIKPIFWDLQGDYVYITSTFGGSGGGDECFPGYGTNGLFRVNLRNGTWVTLVNPKDFPGNKIKFSPTGRRYAVNTNGILIIDINTGEVTQIKTTEVMGLAWSPDGKKLAYSVASCNEEGQVISSSVYIWDTLTSNSRDIFNVEKEVLSLTFWDDNSIVRFEGEKHTAFDSFYTLYVYDITNDSLVFMGPTSLLP